MEVEYALWRKLAPTKVENCFPRHRRECTVAKQGFAFQMLRTGDEMKPQNNSGPASNESCDKVLLKNLLLICK